MEHPLVIRELTRSARRPSTYMLRMAAPAAAFAVFGLYFQFNQLPNSPFRVDDIGQSFVAIELTVLALAIFLGLPFVGAVAIAQEKQDRTLGLLLLADLSGKDIFFAKYLSVLMYGLGIVASGIPALMLSSYFGATTMLSVMLQGGLLIVSVAVVCSVSLLWSTLAPDPRTALFATFGCLAAFMAVSSYLEYALGYPLNPLHVLFLGPEDLKAWRSPLLLYMAGALALAGTCTWAALAAFPSQAYAEVRAVERESRMPPGFWTKLRLMKPPTSPMSALLEFAMAPPGFGARARSRRLSLIVLSVLAVVTGPLMLPLLVVLVAFDVATNMRALMMQGALDDVRVLPVDEHDVGVAIHDAHLRRSWPYLGPALCAGMTLMAALAITVVAMQSSVFQQAGVFDWLSLALCAIAYVPACQWFIRCLVSLTCDCARREHRVPRITATAVATFSGYMITAVYIAVFPLIFGIVMFALLGRSNPLTVLLPFLILELVAIFILRRTAKDYERTFIRLWQRDVFLFAEHPGA